MLSAIKHLVVCGRDHPIRPIAFLDDNRPIGGLLEVKAAPAGKGQVAILQRDDGAPIESQIAVAEKAQSEVDVTEIFWPNGDVQWSIRCAECATQAQMSLTTYAIVADELALQPGPLVPVPTPGGGPSAIDEQRHMIQLRALCDRLGRQNM